MGKGMNLMLLYITVKAKAVADYIYTVVRYYTRSWRYAVADSGMMLSYLWRSPYSLHKKFLIKNGEKDIYTYGETPIRVMKSIAEEANLSVNDTFVELGSGRGRGVLWANAAYGCKSRGIEIVPFFAKNAERITKALKFYDVAYDNGDMLVSDIGDATVVYLYGICLDDITLHDITRRLEMLPSGARVVTVSEPLKSTQLVVEKTFTARYPWGEAVLFLHRKKM